MKKLLKVCLSLVLALAVLIVPMFVNASAGDDVANNQFTPVMNGETLTVPAGETKYFEVGYNQSTTFDFTVSGTGNFDVAVCGEGSNTWYSEGTPVAATNGVYSGQIKFFDSTNFYAGFSITNNSSASADYVLNIAYPIGSMDNPADITLNVSGSKQVTVPAMQSYYLDVTLPAKNVEYQLTITGNTGFGCSSGMMSMPTWDTNGKIVTSTSAYYNTATVVLINNTTSSQTYKLALANMPVGTTANPAIPAFGFNSAKITNSSYYYEWTANGKGLVRVTISDTSGWQWSMNLEPFDTNTTYYYGDTHYCDDKPVVSSEEHKVKTGDTVSINMSLYKKTNLVKGKINWSFEFENYYQSTQTLKTGTKSYNMSSDYEYTVFEFAPTKKGNYQISTTDGYMGIVGYMWVNGTPSSDVVNSESFTWNCTAVGQSILVGVVSEKSKVDITVAEAGESTEQTLTWTTYQNKVNVSKFTTDITAAQLTNVNTSDAVVDKAVLGTDGYYHLNSADGEILYIDLNSTKLSVIQAISFGRFGAVEYEGGKPSAQTDYTTAITEYINAAAQITASSSTMYLYPLTADLIEMYQKVGKDPNRNWYGEEGAVGGLYDDAWMFSTYYVADITDSGDQGGSGDSGNDGGSGDSGNQGGAGNSGNQGGSVDSGNDGGSGNQGGSGDSGNSGNTGNEGNEGNTGNTGNTGDAGNSNESGSVSKPDTSDKSNLILWISLILMAISGCAVIGKIKKQYN